MTVIPSFDPNQKDSAEPAAEVRVEQGASSILDRLFFIFPGILLIADLALTGSGQWSDVMGFSVRRVLLLVVASYATVMWAASAYQAPRTLLGVLGLVIFLLTWAVELPLFYDVPLANALNDSQLFLGLLFAPALAQTIIRIGCWPGALRLIERSIWVLALLHVVIFSVAMISDDAATTLVLLFHTVLEPSRLDVDTNFMIGPIPGGFRVFWGSTIFLLLGFYLAVSNFARRHWLVSIAILSTISVAIFTSMTRAMIISIPIFFLFSWLFDRLLIRIRLGGVLYLIIGVTLMALTLPVVLMANPDFLAIIGLGRDISDDIRYEQVAALTDAIMKNPWLGGGMGAQTDYIRSDDAPWMYELSVLALYMKIGIVGAAWLIAVFVLFGGGRRADVRRHQPLSANFRRALSRIVALLFCIVFSGNTNPYLFSMLGWGLLMFTYVEFCVAMHRKKIAGVRA